MASILDLIRSASGQPDINQQIATALGQAPGQPGSPQGPQPGAGAPAAPPAAGAPPAGPQGPQQAPQQPEAYQSQPDMAQLYFKFAQQQHADDMFSRGIAGIAAGFAPSWDRNAILGMGRDTSMDAGSMFGNLVKMQGWQQQQQQYKAWLDSAGDVAGQLGVTKNEALAMGPDAARTAIALKVPPEQLRVYNAFKQQHIAEHAGDPGPDGQPIGPAAAAQQFEQMNPMGVFMAGSTGTNMDPIDNQRLVELARWRTNPDNKGKPVPAYYGDRASFVAHGQQVDQQTKDRGEAINKFGDLNATLEPLANSLGDVANDAALPSVVGKNIATGFVPPIPGTAGGALDTKLQNLQKQATAAAAKGGPGTAGTLTQAAINAGDLTKYTTPEADYRSTVLRPMMKQTLTAMANNYGAAGKTDTMPAYLRPYLSNVYQPGAELYVGSGKYKEAPEPARGKLPITPDLMTHIQEGIERDGPARTFAKLKAANYDTSSLE